VNSKKLFKYTKVWNRQSPPHQSPWIPTWLVFLFFWFNLVVVF